MDRRLARRLIITGRVQGVGFRYATQSEARRLGLNGWVRNRRDGTVEALIEGSIDAVDALIAWAHHGPPSAQVSHVSVEEWHDAVATGFHQTTTA